MSTIADSSTNNTTFLSLVSEASDSDSLFIGPGPEFFLYIILFNFILFYYIYCSYYIYCLFIFHLPYFIPLTYNPFHT